jgi:chemotaxis protein CheX
LNAEYVLPFTNALRSTVQTMIGIQAKAQPSYFKGNKKTPGDVSAMLGISGRNFVGTITLKFPQELMKKVYSLMIGEEDLPSILEIELYDAVAELVNIVVGGGKKVLSEKGVHFNITVPTSSKVDDNINYGPQANVVVVPFSIDGEEFHMELMMKSIAA